MRSLVTGVDGFIGSWLAEALVAVGDTVVGTTRVGATSPSVTRYRCEMTDAERVAQVVRDAAPERVFHLAAANNVAQSFADPWTALAVNLGGSVNLLEAIRLHARGACVISVGSSAEYGRTSALVPKLKETDPLAPSSPYGVSKAAQGQLAAVYAQAYGLRTIHVRPFAVIGPRKRADAVSDFCRGIVDIEQGRAAALQTGNIEAVRDFVDVRDCAAALIAISQNGSPGAVVNLCNGNGVSLSELLDRLRRVSAREFSVTADPARQRAADDVRIVGDASRLFSLGHSPNHSLEDTLRLTLDYWRSNCSAPAPST
jgi:GDP-4-dehydro-6-deoxy-D-mannose reductase